MHRCAPSGQLCIRSHDSRTKITYLVYRMVIQLLEERYSARMLGRDRSTVLFFTMAQLRRTLHNSDLTPQYVLFHAFHDTVSTDLDLACELRPLSAYAIWRDPWRPPLVGGDGKAKLIWATTLTPVLRRSFSPLSYVCGSIEIDYLCGQCHRGTDLVA